MKRLDLTEDEIDFIRRNIGVMPLEDIGRAIGISHTTVRVKAIKMGLYKPYRFNGHEWTDSEVAYLREHYETMPDSDISDALGISPGTIKRKALEMGLSKQKSHIAKKFFRRYVRNYTHNGNEP